ncbi:NUDIX hydrolase [Catenulispora rubra]|uniref:NUDIX hydrolase n=1 Tax=Catenulispora rubra TaxID=280293 RepID=UPI0018923947|nr:NUDIX domain-containing protein [Catenulispora rubra]
MAQHGRRASFGIGVHLMMIKDGRILLLRRSNTGFADGLWQVPGGGLELGESLTACAAREGKEETGALIEERDLTFAHACQHRDPDGLDRVGMFFTTGLWDGTPYNAETHKASAIDWFLLDRLPAAMVGYGRHAIEQHLAGNTFSQYNFS